MSEFSKILGWDAKGEAIADMQAKQGQQQQYWQDQYSGTKKSGESAISGGKDAVRGQMDISREALGGHQGALRTQFQGLLDDVLGGGRRQAAATGLIAGSQEGLMVNPAIANLGASFGSQMTGAQLGLEQSMLGAEQNMMTTETDFYGGLAGGAQSQAGAAGGAAAAGAGYYSSPAEGFFDTLGDIGEFAEGTGKLLAGGAKAGLWGN